jgi:N-methylhydantoinase A
LRKQTKPEPLVPKSLCAGIDERIAFDGQVFAPLNETTARDAIRRIVAQGIEAIAISLLWSTANNVHELRLRELVQEIAPDLFVSISSEVSPRVGEYERTIATVVNALIGPPMRNYLEALEVDLKRFGYTRSLQIMSCAGGLIDADHAAEVPVLTVGSGPVAGLIGAASLAAAAGVEWQPATSSLPISAARRSTLGPFRTARRSGGRPQAMASTNISCPRWTSARWAQAAAASSGRKAPC